MDAPRMPGRSFDSAFPAEALSGVFRSSLSSWSKPEGLPYVGANRGSHARLLTRAARCGRTQATENDRLRQRDNRQGRPESLLYVGGNRGVTAAGCILAANWDSKWKFLSASL